MAIYCSACNRKLRFFETLYENKYCKECYNKQLQETQKAKELQKKEEEKKKELQRQEEQKRLREQKANEENIKLEKLTSARDYLLYTNYYWVLIKSIDAIPFHYDDIFNNSVKNKFDIIKLLLDEIIIQLPKEFNLNDIKEMNTYRKSAKIIDTVLKTYVKNYLNCEKYYKLLLNLEQYSKEPNNNILDDREYGNGNYPLFISLFVDFENNVSKILDNKHNFIKQLEKCKEEVLEKSKNPNKYDYNKCFVLANEYELQQTYEIIGIYYYYTLIIIYYMYFNRTVDKIIKSSELYTIYTKLKKEVHNNNYIIEKLFPIYNSLYKNNFDIVFEDEDEFRFLIETISDKENVVEKNDYININSSILSIDLNKYINICDENELLYKMCDEMNTNIISYKKFLSIDDMLNITIYSKQYLEVYNKIKKRQAEIEKERILNGHMQQEKEFIKNSLDYSNISNGYEFETFVANLYKLLGYEVLEVTSKSGDQGADVIIEKDNIKFAIQVKYYNEPVGNKAVQEVVAGKNFYKTDRAMVVTNSTFTQQAKALANANDVILVDGARLTQLIGQVNY